MSAPAPIALPEQIAYRHLAAGLPLPTFTDPAAWLAEFNPRSSVVRFAAEWADRMEKSRNRGLSLAATYQDAAYDAALVEPVTNTQHALAACLLARCWKHGPELAAVMGLPETAPGRERE